MSIDKEFDGIVGLLKQLKEYGAHMAVFNAIEAALADGVGLLEKNADAQALTLQQIAQALGKLAEQQAPTITMAPVINVEPTPVQITNPQPLVTIMEKDSTAKEFDIHFTRDGAGMMMSPLRIKVR